MVTEITTLLLHHLTQNFGNKGEAKETKESQMVGNQVELTPAQKELKLCQSLISGSLTLRNTKIRCFGMKFYFSKIRMEPVMLSFLVTTENKKIKRENDRIYNCGKVTEKQRQIAIRNFQENNKNHEGRAVLS